MAVRRREEVASPGVHYFTLVSLLLVVATTLAYARVFTCDFVNLDDEEYVTQNPQVLAGITWPGLKWAFTTGHASNWHPLTWISLQMDAQLFGLSPRGFHATNLALHLLGSVLLFAALTRMTGAIWRSGVVAGLFALHPLHVESVAWVSERKDGLSTVFFMLTLLAYYLYVQRPGIGRLALVALFMALGLMAKPMLVTLPLLLLLLDYWPLRRPLGWSLLVEKAPLFGLAIVSSGITLYVQNQAGSILMEDIPLWARVLNAMTAYLSYVRLMFWPVGLAAFYPHPGMAVSITQAGLGLAFLAIVSAFAARQARRAEYLLVGWLWYLIALLPVLGLVQVGRQGMADRYTYIPLIGLFLALTWGLSDLLTRAGLKRWGAPVALTTLLSCAVLTNAQVEHWQDSRSLWERALSMTSNNYVAENSLAVTLARDGDLTNALKHAQAAVRIRPDFADAHVNLGVLLGKRGKLDDALVHLSEATRLAPRSYEAHFNQAIALGRKGDRKAAQAHLREALLIRPNSADGHLALATIVHLAGEPGQAIESYQRVLELRKDDPRARCGLASALMESGDSEQAKIQYAQVLQLNPRYAQSARRSSWMLSTNPDPELRDGALALLLVSQARPLAPDQEPEMLDALAAAYAELMRFDEAIAASRQAIQLASSTRSTQVVDEMRGRLALYEARKPFREKH